MRRHVASLLSVALTATTAIAVTGAASASPLERRQTDYGFSGWAYGSVAKAESLGVGSGRSAPAWLGCTRLAGSKRHNFVAATGGEAGSALKVTGVDNAMRSYRNRRTLGTRSTSSVAEAVLGDPTGPTLTVTKLRTRSTAFANRGTGKLGARGSARASDVVADTGTPLDLVLNEAGNGFATLLAEIEEAGGTLLIPGLGEIQRGERTLKEGRHAAIARTSALRARLFGADGLPGGNDDVRVVLARSRAAIHDDLRSGVFKGRAVPLQGVVAGDLLRVGRVHARPLPCAGTRGNVRASGLVDADLGNAEMFDADGLSARVFGVQRRNRSARAWTASRVAGLSLGGGEVTLSGITGRVNVSTDRRGRVVRNDIRGSRIGELVIGGEPQAAPSPGDVVEVPGVGTLEFFLRERGRRGSKVTAVRVTLAPGTPGESVIDLGQARTFVQRN